VRRFAGFLARGASTTDAAPFPTARRFAPAMIHSSLDDPGRADDPGPVPGGGGVGALGKWPALGKIRLEDRLARRRLGLPLQRFETDRTGPRILQLTSTRSGVVYNPLERRRRGFDDSSSPSASLVSRDILFVALRAGRNPAESGLFWPFVRTTSTGPEGHFGQSSVSLRPFSSDATEPRPFWYGCRKQNKSMCYRTREGVRV
jgi:hypothetical protein